ncbi:MAG: hypothetical protein AAFZ15_08615 [Bacteroidota bacterium]
MANIAENIPIRGKSIALTSIKSNSLNLLDGRYKPEQAQVLALLRDKIPRTSRQIAAALDKERTNITRSLYDLTNSNKIIISKVAPCPTTKRLVRYYNLAE